MGITVSQWTIRCQECDHTWKQSGQGSVYERQAMESRPCPSCGSYTLASADSSPMKTSRRPGHLPVWSQMIRKSV